MDLNINIHTSIAVHFVWDRLTSCGGSIEVSRSMSAQDVQALMRLMTTGRNKVTLLQAMPRIKALQGAGFKRCSIVLHDSVMSYD